MRALVLAVVCTASTATAAPKLASHYAPLFEKGRTFVYKLSVINFDYIERKDGTYKTVKMKPELSTFTCRVTSVEESPDRVVSMVECDKNDADSSHGFRPDGMWSATKAGVWRGEVGATVPPLIRARPTVRSKRTKDSFGGSYAESVTSPRKGTWCATSDSSKTGAGDGAIDSICFTAGAGVTRGVFDYYGGIPRIVEYTLKK